MMSLNKPMSKRRGQEDDIDPPRDMAFEYRRRAGAWLRSLREDQELTQAQLGEQLEVGHTAVSAVEVGRVSLAPDRYKAAAEILQVDEKDFARKMLRWTNPWLYQMLIGGDKQLDKELAEIPSRFFSREAPRRSGTKGRPHNEKTERQRTRK